MPSRLRSQSNQGPLAALAIALIAVSSGACQALDEFFGAAPRPATYLSPSVWTPDGNLLAWGGSAGCLYEYALDGGEPRLVIADALSAPSFSPDGSELVLAVRETIAGDAGRPIDAASLWIVGTDGSRRRKLATSFDHFACYFSIVPFRPSWSPDGRWIAYWIDGRVELVRPDLSERRQLGCGDDYAWSPDGAVLAYTSREPGGRASIRLAPVDRLDPPAPLTNGTLVRWSPDGGRLAFLDEPGARGELETLVIDADGTNRQRLCAGVLQGWSSTGERILVRRGQGEATARLVTLASEGTRERLLATGTYFGLLSPDGARVAYGRDGEAFVVDADGSNERSLVRPRELGNRRD